MMVKPVPVWKEAPFLRLLLPFAGGILLQQAWGLGVGTCWMLTAASVVLLILFRQLPDFLRFRYGPVAGILIFSMLLVAGALVTYYADVRHQAAWVGHTASTGVSVLVRLDEPPHRLAASYKAKASVEGVIRGQRLTRVTGKILVYFAAEPQLPALFYYDRVLFSRPLEEIKNLGNPGGFDYRRYCSFQGIFHQVYLQRHDYILLKENKESDFAGILFGWREKIVRTLKDFIKPAEAGLAEALLIGYKDDLDKDLVQSYANTGVVHIIAISGLHLGLIYWLLVQLLGWLNHKRDAWVKPLLIIGALWVFALLTGGSPSVMRSAVMFTFVAVGQLARRKGSMYNSLAASAFLLLCYDPYWLWDAGFQLSYTALLGIVLFMRPLYHCFWFANRLLDNMQKMLATSVAAQILTAPLSIYLFHQFPLSFLLANLVAVPLSSLVVLLEIGVCVFGSLHWVARPLGFAVSLLIRGMNVFVLYMEQLPGAVWSGLQISAVQTGLLYAMVAALCCWLRWKQFRWVSIFLGLILLFFCMRSFQFMQAQQQAQIIVYNIPKHGAISLVKGRRALLIADSALLSNRRLVRTSLEPAATLYRFQHLNRIASDTVLFQTYHFARRRILLINGLKARSASQEKLRADIVIVSGKSGSPPPVLVRLIDGGVWVLDSTVPPWRIRQWKGACEKARQACYAVQEKGAFVLQAD